MGAYMRKFLAVAALFVIFFNLQLSAQAHDAEWPGEKLKAMYPSAQSFEQKNLYISEPQRERIENFINEKLPDEDLKPSIYLAIVKDPSDSRLRREAAMMFIDAVGQGGKIEIGVVIDSKGRLSHINIFENKEPPEVSSSDFLDQFKGKTIDDDFKAGKDVKAPPGAEKSAQAIASGARRGLAVIGELFRKK